MMSLPLQALEPGPAVPDGPVGPDRPAGPDSPAPPARRSNCDLAARMIETYAQESPLRVTPGHELPSPAEVARILHLLRGLLYPGLNGDAYPRGATLLSYVEGRLAEARVALVRQVFRGLHHRCRVLGEDCLACEERAVAVTDLFMDELPELRLRLLKDVRAAYEGDPAATGPDEVVFSYPGVQAVTVYRVANALLRHGAVTVPRMMTEQAHAETGIDIHPGATVGESFFIDHGTGVVIGETSVIGDRVRVYQGVTLGALSLPRGAARQQTGRKRHPTIEDDVIIYANATILGGDTVIGKGAIIGGNTWVTSSVPPGARVTTPCR